MQFESKITPNVIAKDEVLKQSQNQTQSRFGNFKKRLRGLSRAIKPRLLRLSRAMTSEGPTRNDKIGVFQSSRLNGLILEKSFNWWSHKYFEVFRGLQSSDINTGQILLFSGYCPAGLIFPHFFVSIDIHSLQGKIQKMLKGRGGVGDYRI